MYEVQVWFNDRLVDTAFVSSMSKAREQVREFMLAYNWSRIELIHPANSAPA